MYRRVQVVKWRQEQVLRYPYPTMIGRPLTNLGTGQVQDRRGKEIYLVPLTVGERRDLNQSYLH